MTTHTCPDQTTLENFLLGKLSAAEQSAIGEHLQSCNNCTASANTLSPQDEITQAIRARRVLTGDEGAVALAAEKGKLLSSQLQTMQPDETVIGDNVQIPPADLNATVTSGVVQTPDEALNFLAPAQGPDELGRLGDYRILELLGMGGMGMVFRAEDARLKRQVALKVMKPSVAASRTAKDRFLREAQFTAAIEHDNIVQIFQVGEDNGVPFIAMPFLKGESLKTRQERVGRMSQKDVLKVGIQVAAGLAAAHERNLIHRDIKPDNIWIEEKTGRAKILDFGLVRATSEDAGLTQSGMVMGTPRYMAPEQALGQDVDHRCDLFSLGSVLYQLASGKLPFAGSNVTATLMAVVQQDPKPLDSVISGLDPAFCDMIARLMRKNRDDRPKSAVEVAKGLTAILQKLKQVDPTVTKAESTPKPVAESAKPEKAAGEIEALPMIVTEPVASLATKKAVKPKDIRAASSIQPPDKPPRRRFLAAAGAGGILLALLGIIVITIRDKDGKETVIRVPEGTEIDVKADPGSKVTIRQEGMSSGAASISNAKSQISNPTTGWHGWPADAPKPAIAPFDAAQAKKHQEEWAAYLKVPVEYTNSIGMKFRLIPPGEFMMGSTVDEIEEALKFSGEDNQYEECMKSEAPQHKVILTQPIYLGVNEVTQAEYEKVMGVNPSHFAVMGAGKDAVAGMATTGHPVEMVSWNDAAEFCAKLSTQEELKPFYFRADDTITPLEGAGYRLPTEAEWESACRAGTTTKFWIGDKDEDLMRAAWFGTNSGGRTHAAGELKPNPYALCDIHGNVFEWVQDVWDPGYYSQFKEEPAVNTSGSSSISSQRVLRGGHWLEQCTGPYCRAAYRGALDPLARNHVVGFRVSLPVDAVRQSLSVTGTAMRNADNSSVAATMPQPSTPLKPRVKIDLTPAPPLGTWEMGPEPPWSHEGGHYNPFTLKDSPVLPGLIERPRTLPGIKRWNVDTLSARSMISAVKYSPDGDWIATGSWDGQVRVYDAQTLQLHRLLPGRAIGYGVIDFSWHPDSQRLAIVADQGYTLRMVDLTGTVLFEEPLDFNHHTVRAVAWNSAGTYLAVGRDDVREVIQGSLEIRDPTGKVLRYLATERGLGCVPFGNVVWSPDDKLLVVRHVDKKVRLWNIETGTAELLDEDVGDPIHRSLAWSKDDWIAVWTSKEIRIYGPDRKLSRTIVEGAWGQPVWSPDAKQLLTLGLAQRRVWDRDSGKMIADVLSVGTLGDWSPDGQHVVFAHATGSLAIVTADQQQMVRRVELVPPQSTQSQWSPDGRWLAISGNEFDVNRVFAEDGTLQPFEFPNDPANAVRAHDADYSKILWRPDGNVLVGGPQRVVSPDRPAKWRLWSRDETGTAREFYSDPSTVDPPYPRCWSPDGKYLIIVQGKGVLKVLDVDGQLVKQIETGASTPVYACWNPVTNLIAVVENEQPLKFIDPARDWEMRTVSEKLITADFNYQPQWSLDGKVLTCVNGWFDDKGQPIPNSYPWGALTWSPDGARFIPAVPDSSFRIVDTATGFDLRVLAVNNNMTSSKAWHPRGNMIAYNSGQSMVSVVRESDLQPHWHAVLLPQGKSATFSGAGELLNSNPEEFDSYLVYYIDRGDGRIETLTPAEFRELLPAK
jgi:serine/threonine protein kinase/formylglycine-generating enzyme required for sulfatase activity/WD40 repeat protein